MAYATVAEMVLKFGETEISRASTPDETPVAGVVSTPVNSALESASAMIDGYLRKRYLVPLSVAPTEVKDACLTLARYTLLTGGGRHASDQVIADKKDVLAWLDRIALGRVLLDLQEVAVGEESFALEHHREPVFGRREGRGGDDDYGNGDWQ